MAHKIVHWLKSRLSNEWVILSSECQIKMSSSVPNVANLSFCWSIEPVPIQFPVSE